MTMPARPSGTFTANSQGQGPSARMAEPMLGPAAAEMATVIAFTPMARPSWREG